jgi:hypothetical protein
MLGLAYFYFPGHTIGWLVGPVKGKLPPRLFSVKGKMRM